MEAPRPYGEAQPSVQAGVMQDAASFPRAATPQVCDLVQLSTVAGVVRKL